MLDRTVARETLAIILLAALSVFVLALVSPAIFNDEDTWWHVSAGQWMLAHRAVLDHDVFSRAFAGRPWITGEWLSEILMAAAYALAGWSGVAILIGLAMGVTVTLLGAHLGRKLDSMPCLVVLVLGIACVMPNYLARPHVLALPCLTIWIIELSDAASAPRRPNWWLLPIMTVWANLHGSFVFGLAFMIPMAIEAASNSKEHRVRLFLQWALFAAGAIAAALFNPHGVRGLIYPFELMRVQSLAAVNEWQPLDLRQFNAVEVAALASAFFFLWRGVRVPPVRLLVIIALFHQTLVHTRYSLFIGIAAPILLADPLVEMLGRKRQTGNFPAFNTIAAAAAAAAFAFSSALRVVHPIDRAAGPASPIAAFHAIPASLAREPVFNNYGFGGYLIFQGVRPLVDSRADFYGDAWLADYWKVVSGNPAAVDRIFRKYGVTWTMLAPDDPLVALLDRQPGWRRLFTDRYAVVHAGPTFAAATNRRSANGSLNVNLAKK